MADEEKNESTEETKDEAEQAPEEAPAEEPKAEEPKAGGAEEAEGVEEAEASPDTPAGQAEDVAGDEDDLDWKTRRRLERSRRPHEARPPQSPEDRAKQRAEARRKASAERRRHRAARRGKAEKGTGTASAERDSVAPKVRRGTVVSDQADKTITVRIDVARRHPAYEKIVRRSSTLHAHDERNEAGRGDLVQVVETRPLSRTKRWRLTRIIEKAK